MSPASPASPTSPPRSISPASDRPARSRSVSPVFDTRIHDSAPTPDSVQTPLGAQTPQSAQTPLSRITIKSQTSFRHPSPTRDALLAESSPIGTIRTVRQDAIVCTPVSSEGSHRPSPASLPKRRPYKESDDLRQSRIDHAIAAAKDRAKKRHRTFTGQLDQFDEFSSEKTADPKGCSADPQGCSADPQGCSANRGAGEYSPSKCKGPKRPRYDTQDFREKESQNDEESVRKAAWKAKRRQEEAASDAGLLGLSGPMVDATSYTPEQLTEVLMRPVTEQADKRTLFGRLHLWIQTVTPAGDDADFASPERVMARGAALFHGLATAEELNERYLAYRGALEALERVMKHKQLLSFRDSGQIRSQQLFTVQTNLDNFFASKLVALDIMSGSKTHVASRISQLATVRPSQQAIQAQMEAQKEDFSTFAKLLDLVLAKAKSLQLVRIDGRVWCPVLTEKGTFTRAYRLWHDGEILEFVHRCAQPRAQNMELWGLLYDRGQYWKQVAEILKYTYEDDFPEKNPSQYWSAWTNGVFCNNEGETGRFYPYNSLAFQNLPKHIVCATYTPLPFENDEYEYYIANHPDGAYGIPTPYLDRICDMQKWCKEERKWWYASIARTLYPAGEHESWAKMWLHLGRAGCGKTTTLKFAASLLPFHKVGLLNNNCEKVFTLQALENTWAWFGMDIKEDWNLDPTLWNTMVDGGLLVIARKYLAAKLVDFKQHGAIAANRMMSWPDLSGQIVRRTFPHIYKESPKELGDPNLFRMMELDKPAAVKKCTTIYKQLCRQYGGKVLHESVLPPNIRENIRVIRGELNPLMAFLDSDEVVCKPYYYMRSKEFTAAFTRFARNHPSSGGGGGGGRPKLPTVSDSFFADVLETKSCYMVHDTKKLPVRPGHEARALTGVGIFIVGCCLKDYERTHPNYAPDKPPVAAPVLPPSTGGPIVASYGQQSNPPMGQQSNPPMGQPATFQVPTTLLTESQVSGVVPPSNRDQDVIGMPMRTF